MSEHYSSAHSSDLNPLGENNEKKGQYFKHPERH